MTEEELKNIEQTTALLVENGLVIKNTDNFIREIGNTNLNDIINKLNALEKTANEGVNISAFVEDVTKSLNSIEELVNNDSYFRSSIGANDFQNLLTNMRGKFTLSQNMLKAEEVLNGRKENLKDVERRILELKRNDSLDDVTRTSETIKLSYALNHAKKAKSEAEEFYKEQKALYDESLKTFDVVTYKNDLLSAINAIDTSYRKLSLEPSAMEKLAKVIRDTRDKIVVFGFEAQKSQKEFAELCKRYGLEKTNAKIEIKEEVVENTLKPVETTEPVEPIENKEEKVVPEVTEPVKKETNEIKNYEELAYEVKRLNPHIEISTDERQSSDGSVHLDHIIYDGESKLVLPHGFSYDKVIGINNKVDDKTPYICLPVEVKKKVETKEAPVAEPIVKQVAETTEPVKEKTSSRKVEPGKKYRVKKVRRAVVAPYVKSVLCFGALGSVLAICAGAGLAPILPVTAIAAGIGAIGQAIYNKMAKDGIVDKESEPERTNDENFEEDVWGLAAIDALVLKSKKMFESLKLARERKKSEPKEEKPNLMDNFKKLFNKNVDEEIEGLDMEPENKDEKSKDHYMYEGEEYILNPEESKGGR